MGKYKWENRNGEMENEEWGRERTGGANPRLWLNQERPGQDVISKILEKKQESQGYLTREPVRPGMTKVPRKIRPPLQMSGEKIPF